MKKTTALCIGIITLIIGYFLVDLLVIGEPVDGNQLAYSTAVNDSVMELHVSSIESAVALRGWKFRQAGTVLSVSARKVLVSPLFPSGSFETTIDLDGVTSICLGGQTIWERSS